MDKTFDFSKFIQQVGEELVRSFADGSSATTPGLVGEAREMAILKKLEKLLPPAIGVGTGCVIDSFGNTSKQMDVILFEKEYCPVFSINDSPKASYYPCEGVLATGEIKSELTKKELLDIFKKSKSVKGLQRYSVAKQSGASWKYTPYRHFGNNLSIATTPEDSYDQKNKSRDQIYFFAICGENRMAKETLRTEYTKLLNEYSIYSPNLFVDLTDFVIVFLKNANNDFGNIMVNSYIDTDYFAISQKRENNFAFTLRILRNFFTEARTVPIIAYERYFDIEEKILNLNIYPIEKK